MTLLIIAFIAVAGIAFFYAYRTQRLDLADSLFMALGVAFGLGAVIGGIIYLSHLF